MIHEDSDFIWDEGNIDHIARHQLNPFEVEDVFFGRVIAAPAYNQITFYGKEKRHALIGQSYTGRILYIVYSQRAHKIRVVTARDATKTEKKRYRRVN